MLKAIILLLGVVVCGLIIAVVIEALIGQDDIHRDHER